MLLACCSNEAVTKHLQQRISWGCCWWLWTSHGCHMGLERCAVWSHKATDMQEAERNPCSNSWLLSTVWTYFSTRAEKHLFDQPCSSYAVLVQYNLRCQEKERLLPSLQEHICILPAVRQYLQLTYPSAWSSLCQLTICWLCLRSFWS